MKYITIFFISLILLTGCMGEKNKTTTNFFDDPDYSARVKPTVRSKKLHLGMKRAEVEYVMGVPDKKKEDLNLYGAYEQWIYKPFKHSESRHWWVYLFFKGNKLVNIKRPNNQ